MRTPPTPRSTTDPEVDAVADAPATWRPTRPPAARRRRGSTGDDALPERGRRGASARRLPDLADQPTAAEEDQPVVPDLVQSVVEPEPVAELRPDLVERPRARTVEEAEARAPPPPRRAARPARRRVAAPHDGCRPHRDGGRRRVRRDGQHPARTVPAAAAAARAAPAAGAGAPQSLRHVPPPRHPARGPAAG